MLKKMYVDNFRCLVNFELSFDTIDLLLGSNGSGKTAVFDVLRRIQLFLGRKDEMSNLFPAESLTRWQQNPVQHFEIYVSGNGGIYRYLLKIEHEHLKNTVRVLTEQLLFDNQPLFEFDESGNVHLYRDNFSEGPVFPSDWSQSGIAGIPERNDNTRLSWFKKWIAERMILVQIVPAKFEQESRQEDTTLARYAENFVSWYRYLYQDQEKAIAITTALQQAQALGGFSSFKFKPVGENHRILEASFKGAHQQKQTYRFHELSDGQQALIVLYTLLHYANSEHILLCIDEPENYVALNEIQPWLTQLYDACTEKNMQAVLNSHHPEIINYLASSNGCWFERSANASVRVKRLTEDDSGMPMSELVARGWIHE